MKKVVLLLMLLLLSSSFAQTAADSGRFLGTVIDSFTQEPIPGILIELRQGRNLPGTFLDSIRTNINGQYLFDSLPLSINIRYSLTASGALYSAQSVTNLILTRDAAVDTVNFVLDTNATPTGTFMGTVTDSTTTEVLPNMLMVLRISSGTFVDSIRTNDAGQYMFDNLTLSGTTRYTLTASGEGYISKMTTNLLVSLTTPIDTVDFELVTGEIPTGTFIGTVTDSLSTLPIANALVLLRIGTGPGAVFVDSTRTDETGNYILDNLLLTSLTSYAIAVSANNYLSKNINNLPLTLAAPIDTVNFKLVAMDTSNSWVFYGTVCNDTACTTPLENATIILATSSIRYSATSDNLGQFSFLIPATSRNYQFKASLEGYLIDSAFVTVDQDSLFRNAVLAVDLSTSVESVPMQNVEGLTAAPNPFNPSVTLSYYLNKKGLVSIDIFNLSGQKVADFHKTTQSTGRYSVEWNASAQPSGTYLVRASLSGKSYSQKIILLK
ncbi:MAG: hypothetical protein A2293_12960 [Elusimicrobia bacterium RIFOXYB2_FULL_49_7]|nr:MAG: hypothetical protein A2293_12960 [Elusimicrobia bacterium RIFOXYB2_FULL_49_7]